MMIRKTLLASVAAAAVALSALSAAPTMAGEVAAADIVRSPIDLPAPLARNEPQTVRVDLETIERVGQLDDGTTYRYRTFDGRA